MKKHLKSTKTSKFSDTHSASGAKSVITPKKRAEDTQKDLQTAEELRNCSEIMKIFTATFPQEAEQTH